MNRGWLEEWPPKRVLDVRVAPSVLNTVGEAVRLDVSCKREAVR